jgi:hypothetical protein
MNIQNEIAIFLANSTLSNGSIVNSSNKKYRLISISDTDILFSLNGTSEILSLNKILEELKELKETILTYS